MFNSYVSHYQRVRLFLWDLVGSLPQLCFFAFLSLFHVVKSAHPAATDVKLPSHSDDQGGIDLLTYCGSVSATASFWAFSKSFFFGGLVYFFGIRENEASPIINLNEPQLGSVTLIVEPKLSMLRCITSRRALQNMFWTRTTWLVNLNIWWWILGGSFQYSTYSSWLVTLVSKSTIRGLSHLQNWVISDNMRLSTTCSCGHLLVPHSSTMFLPGSWDWIRLLYEFSMGDLQDLEM